ncbi:MAG TPA: extracellular solute-binding protein [Thermomicrobiales bacterium]|nr:extracellular solute-binding protein [Thermomicrobiales bacterium]
MHRRKESDCPECREIERLAHSMNRRTALKGAAATAAGAALAGRLASTGAQGTPSSGEQVDPTQDQPQQTFPLTEEKKTLHVMVRSNPGVEDFASNEFTQWFEERTNIHVEWEVLPLDTDGTANTALNLRLASGDYAEVLLDFNPSPSVLQLYGSQGVFLPLNDLIESQGVYSKKVFSDYPAALKASTASDGNVYALPQINDCFHCSMASKLWINQQWTENLGLDLPVTTDDYLATLTAFKNDDPNGNGKADEIPLTGSSQLWNGWMEQYFVNAFTFHPGNRLRLTVVDGKVTPAYTQDGWKEAIRYLASLTAAGVLDPEIFTRDRDQARALGDGNGGPDMVVGSIAAGWWGEFTTYASGEGGPWQQYTALSPLEGPEGVRYAAYDPYQAVSIGELIITDKCEDPELAYKWADALYEIEATTRNVHGVKDRDWAWAEIGETGINGQQAIWRNITNVSDLPTQNIHWSQTGPTYRSSDYRLSQFIAEEDRPTDVEVILYNLTKENYEPFKQPDEMALPPLYFVDEAAQFIAELAPTIQSAVDETFALGVTGQIDIDDAWDGYIASLNDMGLDQFVAYHQEAYDGANQ